jgi:hypothetical protein
MANEPKQTQHQQQGKHDHEAAKPTKDPLARPPGPSPAPNPPDHGGVVGGPPEGKK